MSMTKTNIQPKPCYFCNKKVAYEPLTEMERFEAKVFFCHFCLVEYVYWSNNHVTYSIYSTYRDKMYRWTASNTRARLWYVKNPGIPGTKKNQNIELLKTFNSDIPNITPDNFIDKLPIYLLFL